MSRRKEDRPHPPGTKIAMHMDEALDRVLSLAEGGLSMEHALGQEHRDEDLKAIELVKSLRNGFRASKHG